MAKNQLLSLVMILMVIISLTYGLVFTAVEAIAEVKANEKSNNDDDTFALELKADAINMTWQNLIAQLKQNKVYGDDLAIGLDGNQAYELKVFVSHSMQVQLLRSYVIEATSYGGTLIFKGLPGDSFKELQQLVMKIADDEEHASIHVDDEAFEHYGVTEVPTIVLVKNKVFDKISGNVGLKFALAKFKEAGDLKQEAAELLAK